MKRKQARARARARALQTTWPNRKPTKQGNTMDMCVRVYIYMYGQRRGRKGAVQGAGHLTHIYHGVKQPARGCENDFPAGL